MIQCNNSSYNSVLLFIVCKADNVLKADGKNLFWIKFKSEKCFKLNFF